MTLKLIVFAVLLILVCIGTPAQAQDKAPDLKTTLNFMQNTHSRYTYIHDKGKDQELDVLRKDVDPCRIYVEWEITDMLTDSEHPKVYPQEYQMHLANLDPDSVKVRINDVQKKKPVGRQIIDVHVTATDNADLIWVYVVGREEDKTVPDSIRYARLTDFNFEFREQEPAEKFAKALKHAIELCGGKPSAF